MPRLRPLFMLHRRHQWPSIRHRPRITTGTLSRGTTGSTGRTDSRRVEPSVPFGPQPSPQEILQGIRRRYPSLEGHATGAGDGQPVAVRRFLADGPREAAVRTVHRQEVVKLVGEV